MTSKKLDTGTGGIKIMTSKKLDTGTGGINIDNKVYTYDIGVESTDAVSDEAYSSGDINVDKAPRDLSKGTKNTLGQYLSNTTKGLTNSAPTQALGGGNRYPIHADFSTNFSTTDTTSGNPIGPQAIRSGEVAFAHNLNDPDRDSRHTLPIPVLDKTGKVVSRGMLRNPLPGMFADLDMFDGNDLLKLDKPGNPVKAYSASLIRNRWTAGNEFGNTPGIDSLRKPLAALDYKPGSSYTKEDYASSAITFVTQAQLAAVGNILMARASGEIGSELTGLDPTSATFQGIAALAPGSAQILINRVKETSMTAEDVLRDLDLKLNNKKFDDGIGDQDFFNITGASESEGTATMISWGALNNPYDQFSGFSALGMQILAIAFVAAITLLPTLVSFAFNTTGKKDETKDPRGREPLGRWRVASAGIPNLSIGGIAAGFASGQLDWADLIGFSRVVHPRFQTINTGLLVFFGLDPFAQSSFLKALAPSGPEAYIVFSRAIFRSFLGIADQLKGMAKSAAGPGGALRFVQRLLAFIEYLRGARIMRALNTFSMLGDQVLNAVPNESEGSGTTAGYNGGNRSSQIDNLLIGGKSAFSKSRLIDKSFDSASRVDDKGNVISPGPDTRKMRLAWSSFRAPDMLIMPSGILAASILGVGLGSPKLFPSVASDEKYGIRNGGTYIANDEGRIPGPQRQSMEKILDGEYMPFYFHDIRTNEIISFHAFLLSLGDSYSSSYDSVDAIGRVEPIKTYKGTTRKIDVSFIVAALSHEDFDSMWLKINKLTTMIYPQFSAGKLSSGATYSITIPFSQQIIASPMIRLRIGDLIQSNYSRFNLARLFGYASDTFSQKSNDVVNNADYAAFVALGKDPKLLSGYPNHLLDMKNISGNTFYYTGDLQLSAGVILSKGLPQGFLISTIGKGKGVIIFDTAHKTDTPSSDLLVTKIHDKVEFKVDVNMLFPTPETDKKIFIKIGGSYPDAPDAYDYQQLTNEFMGSNSVVRSFETSGGKGIAGFIESMSFDWYSGTTWEIDEGNRTPKMCKVTISFSPTHDITPGLDWKGANRAPIYPVGPLKQRQG